MGGDEIVMSSEHAEDMDEGPQDQSVDLDVELNQ